MAGLYHTELQESKVILVEEKKIKYEGKMNNPEQISTFMREEFKLHLKAEEYAYMLAFDTANHLLGVFEISHGTVNMTCLSPREVFIRALMCGAVYITAVHNHPSDEVCPSREDREVYERLKKAGEIVGISLLDFIILGSDAYYSMFKENELL